jgi:hypothetical protein
MGAEPFSSNTNCFDFGLRNSQKSNSLHYEFIELLVGMLMRVKGAGAASGFNSRKEI